MKKNRRGLCILLGLVLVFVVNCDLTPASPKGRSLISAGGQDESDNNADKSNNVNTTHQTSRSNGAPSLFRFASRSNEAPPLRRGGGEVVGEVVNEAIPRLIELPATHRGEVIVRHKAYTLSFNTKHNNPNWVAWELTADEVNGTGRRSNDFMPDPDIEERHRVTTDDYRGSGYDRGHMCPAGDNKWNARAMTESFYMSNMCPQLHELNSGGWESLESACRRWAKTEERIYIVCGPLYDNEVKARRDESSTRKLKTIGKQHKITVPTGFFKCVLSLREGKEKAIAFVYSNDDKRQTMEDVCLTVDEVEELTGYDFFVNVPKKVQNRVESKTRLSDWK